jgi:hypothetical protein
MCPGDNEALTGDLIEKFREGRTQGWFWRHVLIAIAVGVLGDIRRHWPYFCYAAAGVEIPAFFSEESVQRVPGFLHWWALPWPLSQLVFDLSPSVLVLAALPVLAVALLINREFRWICLFRTGLINMALVALLESISGLLVLFPWLQRPTADPHGMTLLIMPPALAESLFFCSFLLSAWLGCASTRRATPTVNPA